MHNIRERRRGCQRTEHATADGVYHTGTHNENTRCGGHAQNASKQVGGSRLAPHTEHPPSIHVAHSIEFSSAHSSLLNSRYITQEEGTPTSWLGTRHRLYDYFSPRDPCIQKWRAVLDWFAQHHPEAEHKPNPYFQSSCVLVERVRSSGAPALTPPPTAWHQ